MKRKPIRNVIILGTISIVGIIVTQIYWINKAWNFNENQFNHAVNVSLRNVANEILMQRGDSSAYIEPIRQVSSNYFVVSINDTLHPYLLETLLKNEFKSRNIEQDFEYGIYDCFTDSIVYGNYVRLNPDSKRKKERSSLVKWDKDGHYFGVYFPAMNGYLVSQMGIWIFSSSILLIVIAFFSYAMFVILKQKRLSEITTDFINNMTHEFKTPISTISLSSEILMKPEIINHPERIQRYSHIIFDENSRLKNMVERVLQMATLDRTDFKLNKKEADVNMILQQCAERFNLAINEKKGKISCKLNAENSIIMADRVHLTNIFSNIIDNAIKYSEDSPEVTIATENAKNGIVIRVYDNGIGMSKEAQKQVFNKFYRVPTGDVHDVKGFGLGLNYVKIMVDAHHGSVKLESESGVGSIFEIFLPFK